MRRANKSTQDQVVLELAKLGCTPEEIGSFLGCDADIISHRFEAVIEKGYAELKIGLRRAQLRVALAGNVNMLTWLGKHLLGQGEKDASEIEREMTAATATLEIDSMSPDQQVERILKLIRKGGFSFAEFKGS